MKWIWSAWNVSNLSERVIPLCIFEGIIYYYMIGFGVRGVQIFGVFSCATAIRFKFLKPGDGLRLWLECHGHCSQEATRFWPEPGGGGAGDCLIAVRGARLCQWGSVLRSGGDGGALQRASQQQGGRLCGRG